MSPPFFNFNRRLPALSALARSQTPPIVSRETNTSFIEDHRSRFVGSVARLPDDAISPLYTDLETTITLSESMARGGAREEYAAALQLRARQLQDAHHPEARQEIRVRAIQWAEEALQALATATGFARDRVRSLYDCVLALSAILAREGHEEIPEAERELLLRFFIQIRGGIAQHREEMARHPDYPPIPDYFESYARGEQALLEGHADSALAAFLETRNHIRELPGSGLFRARVAQGTEYAIRALQRDASGHFLENLRSRSNLDALLLFDQVDGGDSAEIQALSLVSIALAEGELRGASTRGILEHLTQPGNVPSGDRESHLHALEELYESRPAFREACLQHLPLAEDADPRQVCEDLLQGATRAAERILGHRDQEPYATVFHRDSENRPLREALEQLQSSQELADQIAQLLGLPLTTPRRDLVQNLVEYGPLARTMLQSLAPSQRETPSFTAFSSAILQVAEANSAEGRRRTFELPLESLVNSLGEISRDDDRYAPAYEYFFRTLSETSDELAPGVELPPSLRRRCESLRASIVDFNPRRLFRHLVSADSLLSLAGGIALTELMPLGILRYARNGGTWLRAGRLTWQAELGVGLGVGFAMSTVGGIHHLASSPHPWREELQRVLPQLALGTLFSSLAMSGTMGVGALTRRVFLPAGTTSHLFLRQSAARTLTLGTGGALILGAETMTEGLGTGHWRAPTWETTAESYLNLLLWEIGASGLHRLGRRYWWRAQLGPHQVRDLVDPMVTRMMERNPWLSQTPTERLALENYLGRRVARGENLSELRSRLDEGMEPYWYGSEIHFRNGRETSPENAPHPADELRTPGHSLSSEAGPMDEIHNIPFAELEALWSLPMRALPREILSSPLLRPIHRISVGAHEFYLSRVIEATRRRSNGETERRSYVLALVPVEVQGRRVLKRRFFYSSGSDAGAWRCSPFMIGDRHLVKGLGRHYTQETQPVWEISEALTRLEGSDPAPLEMQLGELLRYISAQSEGLGPEGARTMMGGFQEEVEFPRAMGMSNLRAMRPGQVFALPPGWGWGSIGDIQNTLRQIRSLSWPEGFIPDFTQDPARELRQPNSLLGPLSFREYRGASALDRETGRRRPLVWIMGEDGQGRAWVRHLHYADSEVNSYGVYSEVLESGILTSKPLEYIDQAGLLPEALRRPFNRDYVDISPTLTLLEPIRRYREARGLSPLLTEEQVPTLLDPQR